MRRLRMRLSLAGLAIAAVATAASLAGSTSTPIAAADPSDLIDVVQVGTGAAPLSNAATAAFILPVRWDGSTVAKGAPIALPTADAGSQHAITESGSASSESLLELSGDGNYLTLGGYDAVPGTAAVGSTTSSSTPRVIARIDGSGTIDTSTALTDAFSTSNFRGVVTDNGTHFWAGGDGGSVSSGSDKNAGVVYVSSLGATTSIGLETAPKQARAPVIAGGNLYFSTSKSPGPGVFQLGSGLPTSTASVSAINAEADPYSFVLLHTGTSGTAPDTAYVADGTNGGVFKYTLNGSTWTASGNVSAGSGVGLEGLAGRVEGGGVQLYATTIDGGTGGNRLLALTDTSGYGNTINGSFTTVATAPANTAYKGVAFAPSGQTITLGPPTITLADAALSRSIGDSYSPNQTTATVSDSVYSPAQLAVSASSDNPAVVPTVSVTGSGSTRTITVTSNNAVGLANITVTVQAPDGRTASSVLQYGVSAAAPDATSNFLYDFSNASTAIDAGGGYYLVGDDEFNQLALYQGGVSGPPVKTWNFDSLMGVADTSQLDLEASARLGNTIYWFGSEGNNSDGSVKPNRAIVFATTITGSGASTDLSFAGYYKNLRNDLIAWDQANGNQFGFAAGAAEEQIPKEVNGFNIEGAEFAAGGSGTLYLGFRAPIVPTSNRTRALVVPVTNLASLISSSGTSGSATFGAPLSWNLTPAGYVNGNGDTSALGIREIRKNADDQYLIIAGSYEEVPAAPSGGAEFLYTWDGNVADQPVLTSTVLPTPDDGSWETIVAVPDPLTDGSSITMIQDDGDNDLYGTGMEAKDLTTAPSPLQKDRADVITVALATQAVSFTTAVPAPAYAGTSYAPAATGGATGNPVTFSIDASSGAGACSLSGSHVILSAPGSCVLDADQAGSFQYAAGHASQTIHVVLPPPPVVTVPPDQSVEATGPAGSAVSFSASATDVVDGALPATCAPVSGSTFPLGATTVRCSATDSQGVSGSSSFTVTVRDTTPPVLTLPADQYVDASGPAGALVSFQASSLDAVDGSVPVVCVPASGTMFPVGVTHVACSATDAHGNRATGSFAVTVLDAPILHLPANLVVEATGPNGATARYEASANDPVDGPLRISCAPRSGSTFPIGTTDVSCSATNVHHTETTGTFSVTVQDTTPPKLFLPRNKQREATGPSGRVVTFFVRARDTVDGPTPVSCSPASGTSFPVGATTVDCTATDAHGNTATGSFVITVTDTTPPRLSLPNRIVLEATGPSGAIGDFTASAADLVDGSDPVTCSPASGSTFPVGTTVVHCSASDAHGNSASGQFVVVVRDTTPPVLHLPQNLTVPATGSSGAVVDFAATASDAVDGVVPVTCSPASGSTFRVGTTAVRCSAVDASGNRVSGTFSVTVTRH